MKDHPRVSVILPTYDRPEVVKKAARSVLEQTFSNLELLVVDSSTDKQTQLILKRFNDERIKYLSQPAKGLGAARNLGIDNARGEYIAFQDDDDEWYPEKLERQLEVIEDCGQQVGVVYTTVQKISGDTTWTVPQSRVNPKEGEIHESLQYTNFVSPQTALVRTQCFDEVGLFDETLPSLEDWELWIRISERFQFKHIPEQLVTAYLSPDSLSRDFKKIAEARETIVRKHLNYFDSDAIAEQFFWAGHGFMKTGRTRQGRANLRRALQYTFRSRYIWSYLLSLLGSRTYASLYRLFKLTPGRSNRA